MAEYIERKMAIVEACNSLELYPSEYAKLEDALNKIPPAYVAPVRHGRWWRFVEQRFYDGDFIIRFRCSECQSPTDRGHNYCPNCGAKMD